MWVYKYYVYIVRCEKDNSFYTGYTSDLDRRVRQHNNGIGSKYTRSHGPVQLLYYEMYRTRKKAMHREREIKKLSRKRKKLLMRSETN
ncbi:MAG: GIY-YIG nuclease family protein [Candidatus Helarchaeota archaeon]|nr:GIY-YIG nuclease family protein [Candidatus Helarchaeota archaeon]